MATNKKNRAKDYDAVIVFDSAGVLDMVVPDEFYLDKDEPVRWLITPQGNQATVDFGNDTPLTWSDKSDAKEIQGQTKKSMKGRSYKYSVTAGDAIIDPHIRIGKH